MKYMLFIIMRQLRGGWAGLCAFIVVSVGCVDLGHLLMEGRFLLGRHLLVRQLNVLVAFIIYVP